MRDVTGVPSAYFGFDPAAPGGERTAYTWRAGVSVKDWTIYGGPVYSDPPDGAEPFVQLRFYSVINLELVDGVWCRR